MQILKRMIEKIGTICVIFIFFISMLPNWGLAFIARPAGDDYGYSAATRQVWLKTHSLFEVIKTSLETTKEMCNIWNGDWFSVFVFTLMPEAFAHRSFWIVPVFWSLATIGATYFLFHQLFTKILGIKWYETLTISMLVLLMSYQWIPSSGIVLYWYVGVIHYIMPHVIAVFLLGFLVKFGATNKIQYIILSAIGMIAIGGSSYYSMFLVILTYLLVLVCGVKRNRKLLWLICPSVTGLIALYCQIKMPGNAARVGESIGFTWKKGIEVVLGALLQGLKTIQEYVIEKPFIILLLILIAMILWCSLVDAKLDFKFGYPALFVGYMYGIYASMFAPEIYAATEISGGPPTMEYLTFLLVAVVSIAYVEAWLIVKMRERDTLRESNRYCKYGIISYLCMLCVLAIFMRGEMKETLFYESVEYIFSGAAADYAEQMKSQEEILLDDSIKEAYLCPTNDQQGPLMHMPVIDNPDAFTNTVIKEFYGKDYVVAIMNQEQ